MDVRMGRRAPGSTTLQIQIGGGASDGGGASKSYRGEARGQNYKPSKKSSQGYQGGRSEGGGNNRGRSNRGRSNRGRSGNRN